MDGDSKDSTQEVRNSLADCGAAGAFHRRDPKTVDWKAFLRYGDYNGLVTGQAASWSFQSRSYANWAAWNQATGFDGHSLSATAGLVDTTNGDFRLAPGSRYAAAGVNRNGLSPGRNGQAPSLGAYPRGDDGTIIGPGGTSSGRPRIPARALPRATSRPGTTIPSPIEPR